MRLVGAETLSSLAAGAPEFSMVEGAEKVRRARTDFGVSGHSTDDYGSRDGVRSGKREYSRGEPFAGAQGTDVVRLERARLPMGRSVQPVRRVRER